MARKTKRHPSGYLLDYQPNHPDAMKNGYILQHRLVMERAIGRRLLHNEHVHHLNGNRGDNRLENLELLTASEHAIITNRLLEKAALMRSHRWLGHVKAIHAPRKKPVENGYRVCNKCHAIKPLSDFFANRSRPLGRGYWCKACQSTRVRNWVGRRRN